MMLPLITMPGGSEILLILLIVVLLFGAKKLPELARGSGRALRIFKAETKGLMDDDDKTDAQREIDARQEADRVARERDYETQHPVNRTDEPGTPGTR